MKEGDVVNLHGGRIWYEVRLVFPETEDLAGRVIVDRHERNQKSATLTIPEQAWSDIVRSAATVQGASS